MSGPRRSTAIAATQQVGLEAGDPVSPGEYRQQRLFGRVTLLVVAEALRVVVVLDWLAAGAGFGVRWWLAACRETWAR
jgi:hypothetical protein